MSERALHDRLLEPGESPRGGDRPWTASAWSVPGLAWVTLAMLAAVVLDGFHLGRPSLWNDEFFSRYYYDLFGLHSMLTDGLQREPTPPTYFIVLRGWMALFGDSEVALRSLSVVAYAAAVPAVYRLARAFGPAPDAVLAAFLFALSPFGLHFAQEVRTYTLMLLPATLVLWGCAAFLDGRRMRLAGWLYVPSATVCLYLHATMVFFVAAAALTVAGFIMLQRRDGWQRNVLHWLALNVATALLASPYLVNLVGASQGGGLDWISPLRARDVVAAVAAATTGVQTPLSWAAAPICALLLGALAWSMWRNRPPAPMLAVLVVIPVVFLGLLVAVSLVRPILLPRVMCWTIIPLCVLTGRQMLHGGRARAVVIAVAALACGAGLFFEMTSPNGGREPWREAYAELAPDLRQADLIVLGPHANPLHSLYYGPGPDRFRLWDGHLRPTSSTEAARLLHIDLISREQILSAIAGGEKVVLLANTMDEAELASVDARYPAARTRLWPCGRGNCIEAMTWGLR